MPVSLFAFALSQFCVLFVVGGTWGWQGGVSVEGCLLLPHPLRAFYARRKGKLLVLFVCCFLFRWGVACLVGQVWERVACLCSTHSHLGRRCVVERDVRRGDGGWGRRQHRLGRACFCRHFLSLCCLISSFFSFDIIIF